LENVTVYDSSGAVTKDKESIKNILTLEIGEIVSIINSLQNADNNSSGVILTQLDNFNFSLIIENVTNLSDSEGTSFNLSSDGYFIGVEQNGIPVIAGVVRTGLKISSGTNITAADTAAASSSSSSSGHHSKSKKLLEIIIIIPIIVGLLICAAICCICTTTEKICCGRK